MKNTMKKPVNIPVSRLRPFEGHPFKVKDDEEMFRTHNRHNKIEQDNSCSYIQRGAKRQKEIECPHPTLRLVMNTRYGPSDRIRTCGILLPKQARYQLRYTRLFSYLSGWAYSPKAGALPSALHPVIWFLSGWAYSPKAAA